MKNYLIKSSLIIIVFFNVLLLLLISYYKQNYLNQSDFFLSFFIYQLIYLIIFKNFNTIYNKILTINIIFIPITLFSTLYSLIINGFYFNSIKTQSFILSSIIFCILIILIYKNISFNFLIDYFKNRKLKFKKINKKHLFEILVYFIILLCIQVVFNI